jgi:hypothetical protein
MKLKHLIMSKKMVPVSVYIVLAAFALGVVALLVYRAVAPAAGLDTSKYQIVTLTTGESFIGRLSGLNRDYVLLENVYYQQNSTAQSAAETPDSQQVTVLRLSDTVAKPENTMRIAKDKLVHWENLSNDSKIIQAIKQDAPTR